MKRILNIYNYIESTKKAYFGNARNRLIFIIILSTVMFRGTPCMSKMFQYFSVILLKKWCWIFLKYNKICTTTCWAAVPHHNLLGSRTAPQPAGQPYCTTTCWAAIPHHNLLGSPATTQPAGQPCCATAHNLLGSHAAPQPGMDRFHFFKKRSLNDRFSIRFSIVLNF